MVEAAFEILEMMISLRRRIDPDDTPHISFLDRCAQAIPMDEANRLLSVLVKLCIRGTNQDGVLQGRDQISRKYRFKTNGHVYEILIQAGGRSRLLARAKKVLDLRGVGGGGAS